MSAISSEFVGITISLEGSPLRTYIPGVRSLSIRACASSSILLSSSSISATVAALNALVVALSSSTLPSSRATSATVDALNASVVALSSSTLPSSRVTSATVAALNSATVASILLICSSVAALNSLIVSTTHPENCISSFVVAESSAISSFISAKTFLEFYIV